MKEFDTYWGILYEKTIYSMDTQEETDEHVAQRVQGGDAEAFGALIERYEERMRRYARRFLSAPEDIEDAVQEVFIKAYRNIQSFDVSQHFSPWLYRVAHNNYANMLRKKSRDPLVFVDLDTFFPNHAAEEETDRHALERESKEAIESALLALTPKYREPLVLFFFESLEYRTIADILQIPVGTVGVRIRRGKQQLEAYLKKQPL